MTTQNFDYKIALEKINATIDRVDNHAYATGAMHHAPRMFWSKNMDHDLFNIINHLADLQLHKEATGLTNNFSAYEGGNDKDKIQFLLDSLYLLFDALSIQEKVEPAELKKLKKLIARFAEKNGLDRKLFNIEKILNDEKYRKDQGISDETYTALKADKEIFAKKYAYLRDEENKITAEKEAIRRRKKLLNNIAIALSIIIGVGEGLIAAVFFGWLLVPSILLVGTCGFLVSYFLFKQDCYDTLKDFFVVGFKKAIFTRPDGQKISPLKKSIMSIALLFVIASAAVMSAFSFTSTIAAVTGLLALGSIVCPPVALALAAFLGLVTLAAMTALFYRMTAQFIRDDGYKKVYGYFKENFYDIWVYAANGSTGKEKAIHYGKIAATFLFRSLFFLGTLAVCVVVTAGSLGMGYSQSLAALSQIPNITAKAMQLSTLIGYYILSVPLNLFFYNKSVLNAANLVRQGMEFLATKIKNLIFPSAHQPPEVGVFDNLKENKLHTVNLVFKAIKDTMFLMTAVVNGIGNARGYYTDGHSVANTQAVTHLPAASAAAVQEVVACGASISINGGAYLACNQQTTPVTLPNAGDKMVLAENTGDILEKINKPVSKENKVVNSLLILGAFHARSGRCSKVAANETQHNLFDPANILVKKVF